MERKLPGRRKTVRGALGVVTLGVLVACSSTEAPTASVDAPVATGDLGLAFAKSADEASVPRDLLVAIAQVEEGLQIPAERPSLDEDSHVPAAGPLMLRRGKLDTLALGASLMKTTELELRKHADLALRAGAHVLAELGRKTGADPADLTSWKDAIEEMGGFADAPHREQYAHRVFATLARGGSFVGRGGEIITLAPHDLPPTLTLDIDTNVRTLAMPEFEGAEVFPTSCNNKCNTSRGASVQYVAIHDTEGSWNASVATLQNDPGKSCHYIIGTDGRIGQFVTESTLAWHIGNSYYNARSVGIEHVGYFEQPYPEVQYEASAKLVNYLIKKYDIPADRAHIIGHNQAPDGVNVPQSNPPCMLHWRDCKANYGGSSHHTDPGVWEWATYMPRIGGQAKCNDIWNLWNCSSNKKRAFRCVNDTIEIRECASECQVQSDGTDDLCTPVDGASGNDGGSDPGKPSTTDGGGASGDGNGTTNPGHGDDGDTDEQSVPPGDDRDPRKVAIPKEESVGCSVVRTNALGRAPVSVATGSVLALGLAALARRTSRRPKNRRRS